ncbi:hypothetical protein R3P38DRAFT_2774504 [Favolaschia claudopus]|uniref:Odorant receptor n=1 Tax=Favolaschia claudopus TaxID=2862362 RepID=A0AAW0BYV2_9AGAR
MYGRPLIAMQASVKRMLWNDSVELYLRRMDNDELFQTSLTGRMAGRNVHIFLGMRFDDAVRRDLRYPEMQEGIIRHPLNDRYDGGQITSDTLIYLMIRLLPPHSPTALSPDDAQLRGLIVQYRLSRILESFGIYFGDIFLLHALTGTLVSGEAVEALLNDRVLPHRIDFYCAKRQLFKVAKFLNFACGFSTQMSSVMFTEGIIRCEMVLCNEQGAQIRIVQSNSDNPLHVIPGSAIAGQAQQLDVLKFSAMQVSVGRLLYSLQTEGVRSYLCIAKLSVLIVILVAAPSAVQAIKTHRFNPDGGLQHKSVAFTFRRLTRADSGTLSAQDLRIRTLLAQYMIVHALSLFDLSYGDIKLMQAATDTRISGSVVTPYKWFFAKYTGPLGLFAINATTRHTRHAL